MDDEAKWLNAYADGYEAWRAHKNMEDNPYDKYRQCKQHWAWRDGYLEAELDEDGEDY